jgi:hypothetical protein
MLARVLAWLRKRAPASMPSAESHLRNYSDEHIRAEFKRRYLVEFASYVGRDRVASAAAGANFLLFATMLGGTALAGPVAGVIGVGVALWRVEAARRAKPDLERATARVVERLGRDERTLVGVEAWLDRHLDVLPTYLDRLDQQEAAERRERALIDRINRGAADAGLTAAERAFLATRGIKNPRPPIGRRFQMPPRTRIGNWHHAQLARALWREIGRR